MYVEGLKKIMKNLSGLDGGMDEISTKLLVNTVYGITNMRTCWIPKHLSLVKVFTSNIPVNKVVSRLEVSV
jgi:hypothetical protein